MVDSLLGRTKLGNCSKTRILGQPQQEGCGYILRVLTEKESVHPLWRSLPYFYFYRKRSEARTRWLMTNDDQSSERLAVYECHDSIAHISDRTLRMTFTKYIDTSH